MEAAAHSHEKSAMVLTTSHLESLSNVVRQEEMCRHFCFKSGLSPALTVRVPGSVSVDAISSDTWNLARSHGVRHVVFFKASAVEWRVAELFAELGEKLGGVDCLWFVADGFLYDDSPSPFKPVDGMETMIRCVLCDVMRECGGVLVPGAPSVASQCLMDRYLLPFGSLLAMFNYFSAPQFSRLFSGSLEHSRTCAAGEKTPRKSVRRSLLHGYVDTLMYQQAAADARRERERERRRHERDNVLAVCRSLHRMRVADDSDEDV
ncbi:hypothetical protein SePPVgORF009 [Seal parapoxvirus]|uniref:Protein OPG061 n=1 Tax=Seal parapoxvirus TaxID=187984 RepID=A0A1Z4CGB7_9POXV|nr:hypothetical protein CGV03_gp009 [Seal parapoxvirus]ASF89962.1 hypothetical protein SePPVgORF009 [Seal parapoxvirus]